MRGQTSHNKQKHDAHTFDKSTRAMFERTQPTRGTSVEFAQHSLPRVGKRLRARENESFDSALRRIILSGKLCCVLLPNVMCHARRLRMGNAGCPVHGRLLRLASLKLALDFFKVKERSSCRDLMEFGANQTLLQHRLRFRRHICF